MQTQAHALPGTRPAAESAGRKRLTNAPESYHSPAAQRPSGPAAQRPSGPAAQRPSGPAAQRPSGPAAQRPSGPAAQRPSGPAAQRPSGMNCARRLAGARKPVPSGDLSQPEPRSGRARRLSPALPILALLAGILPLFAPAPAEARHLLESTLQTTNFGQTVDRYGCENARTVKCTTSNLNPNTFTFNGKQWSVTRLFINDGQTEETLQISFSPAVQPTGADADAFSRLQLRVGSVTFSFQTGDNGAYPLTLGTSRAGNTILGTSLTYGRVGNEQHMQTLLSEFSGGSTIEIELYDPDSKATGVELESAAFLPGGAEGHDLVIPEGGSATFGVRLSTQPAANVTVNLGKLVAQPLDATPEEFHASVDAVNAVTVSPETLTFTPTNWSALQTVTVTTTVDDDAEHEHVIVYAQWADGHYWANGVYVTVTDPGNAPQVGAQPASGRESGDGSGIDIPIAFWLRPASSSPVTVRYRTADGTATAGSDYTATNGTVAFAAGETSKTVNVRILDDTVEDSGETFFVELSNPSGATIAPHYDRVRVTILNDETGEFTVTLADNSGGGAPRPTHNNNGGNNDETDELAAAPADNGNADSGSSGSGGGFRSPSDPSSRAALSDLVVTPRDEDGNPGKRLALSPAFAPSATAYTLDVPYPTGALDIAPGLTGGTAARRHAQRRDHQHIPRRAVLPCLPAPGRDHRGGGHGHRRGREQDPHLHPARHPRRARHRPQPPGPGGQGQR